MKMTEIQKMYMRARGRWSRNLGKEEAKKQAKIDDFKPHKMYDKDGTAHDANTLDTHLRMKKLGYSHEKPVNESAVDIPFHVLREGYELAEAVHDGKKVKLNDPIRTNEVPSKKFKVYTMGPNKSVVVVRFGDPDMEIKRDDPKRRASYRARHNCDNPGPKWKANYWSCHQWRSGSKVDN